MRRWFVTAAMLARAIAGCTLLVDTSGLADGSSAPELVPPDHVDLDARALPEATTADGTSGPIAVCPPGAILCDDFESGLGKWEPHTDPNGRVDLVSDVVHAGKGAFRAMTIGGASGDFQSELRRALSPKVESGLFVVRAWMRFEGKYVQDTALIKLRAASGSSDMNLKIGADLRLQIDADVPGAGPELDAADPVPLDRWVCVEWQATLGTPGHSKLILDGKTVVDADENNVPPGGYGAIGIGFVGLTGPDQRVFMDDIVIASAPVGCP